MSLSIAQKETRDFVAAKYGADFLPPEPPQYKTKTIGAQEAHEAIRPTSVMREPEQVKPFLETAMYKLYNLIWQRFVASQMEAAVYDTLQVEVTGKTDAHEYLLRASGSAVKFPGFLVVYEEAKNEDVKTEEDEENVKIPAGIAEGQKQESCSIDSGTTFYSAAATLFGSIASAGIGRRWDWTSVHIRADDFHDSTTRICGAR